MIQIDNQTDLNQHLNAHPKVLALFYASWCPFCRSFLSIFNKHAQTPSDLTYLKVQVDEDENPLWETYGFEAVPSLILFENGAPTRKLYCRLGAGLNEKQFLQWLNPT
jgi:thioredoxin 1